ncbi:MAG: hypothetical protein F4Z80_03545 [Chloroflexi bacterium]|nr:hypothetical protein [Chloroflexota bacterium]MYC47247.1 hypothetical protein [Chloroflexota bacterium]
MDIASTFRHYDGKRVAPFRQVMNAVRGSPESAVGELLDLAASDELALQVGATWVLRNLVERGAVLDGRQAEKLLRLLGQPIAPDALLHVLQTLPHMEVEPAQQGALHNALMALIKSRRAFIRAWAYNGLGILAAREPSFRNEVLSLLDQAAGRETAAVKARIRHARAAIPNEL